VQHQPILAAVDLGSNSFRLQIARVVDDQLYMLDGLREPVRLAAGLDADDNLDEAGLQRGLDCLQRFSERLRGLPVEAVRAVGTNTLRVAKNAADILPRIEAALGFPIEVIPGHEEARLIYLGVAHGLPPAQGRRLVMDIGGGSTEFIIGEGLESHKLESLYMGSVSYSLRFFSGGKVTKTNLRQAELAARNELQAIVANFKHPNWDLAFGSSGTARVVSDILEQNGYSEGGITRAALELLRERLLRAGDVRKLELQGVKPDRVLALPGGFAILYAAFCELGIEQMQAATGALREGVLYDLLGRFHDRDMRDVTVQQFTRRYHLDQAQAGRVGALADKLARQFLNVPPGDEPLHPLDWAAKLHEVGISIAHSGYHKHSAYILKNADMPGFSSKEQDKLSLLALAQRGGLDKLRGMIQTQQDLALVLALRLAILFCRNRSDNSLPPFHAYSHDGMFYLVIPAAWMAQNPLTDTALKEEVLQWKLLAVSLHILKG